MESGIINKRILVGIFTVLIGLAVFLVWMNKNKQSTEYPEESYPIGIQEEEYFDLNSK